MTAIREKAVSATFWSGVETAARQGLQFSFTLVLARLLTPQDYGTIALMAIFIGLAQVFINSGFFSAVIQRQGITETDLSSVFFFNLGMSLVGAAVLYVAAPGIAAFYRMPILKPLTWVLCADLVIGSLGALQRVLLIKSLNFRLQCAISIIALCFSGGLAVFLAYNDYAVWSLAWQTLTFTLVSTVLLWVLSPWRPSLIFSVASIRSLFRFGGFLLMSSILDVLYTRLSTLIIGKLYSARDLGYYSRAESTSQLPGNLMTSVLSSVGLPIFSAIQEDKTLLKQWLRKYVLIAMFINIPVMLGIAVTARPLVLVLFGSQWLACVPYLQILSLAGILWPLHVLNLNVLTAQGHSNRFFRLEVIKKAVCILLLGTACLFGLIGIAWATVVASIICFVINAHYSGRLLGYSWLAQTTDLLPYAGVGLVMAGCAASSPLLIPNEPVMQLLVGVLTGATVYGALGMALRLEGFTESWDFVKSMAVGRLLRAKV